ncbi:MAG: GerMN domain-containing protein [Chloroflexi bacterium]|nr:GerMN domain-containing protein [Chloroflexota bacterium]
MKRSGIASCLVLAALLLSCSAPAAVQPATRATLAVPAPSSTPDSSPATIATRSPAKPTAQLRATPASPVPIPATPVAVASPVPAARPTLIDVFFSRKPQSYDDFSAVFPVQRKVLDGSQERLAGVALEQLIAGPTPAEQTAGYFSEFEGMLHGESNCGGPSFTLRMNGDTAIVRLCRTISSAGVGQDARTRTQIEATLKQFSSIRRVVLLSADGHCLFDLSGLDLCLRATPTVRPP